MSLADKKSALFGKGSPSSAAAAAAVSSGSSSSSTPSSKPMVSSNTITKSIASTTGSKPTSAGPPKITQQQKLKKIEEAKELSEKATKYLKTSVFNWSPDHLAAAPLYEQSADLYKNAEEYGIAISMLTKAAESHEAYGSLSSAALTFIKAAKIASQNLGNAKQAAEHYQAAANLWAINGSLDRCADYLAKAAKELETDDMGEAIKLYERACEMLCPADTPKDSLSKSSPSTIDTYRAYFRCLIAYKGPDESLIPVANRMIDIFESYGIESSMCKMMLTVTLLELYMGDVVRAENTYLNTHLNNPIYIRSKECELADLYVLAFKRQDVTKLDEAQHHSQINYLDKEIQTLAKQLSLFRTKHGYIPPEEVEYNKAAEKLSKDMEGLMKSVAPIPSHSVPTHLSHKGNEGEDGNNEGEIPNLDDIEIPTDDYDHEVEQVDEFVDHSKPPVDSVGGDDDEIDLS